MVGVYREAADPYPGLRPFESHEAEIFFGREEHTDRLLEILRAQRFLAVIGPSGSGKSSLVRAGLLPSLAMGSLGSGSQWRVAVMRPGDRPLENLAAALLAPDVLANELGSTLPGDAEPDAMLVATVAAELRRGPLGLLHLVRGALHDSGSGAPNLLVLVDQFEELFTYAEAAGPRRDESLAFVQLLLEACRDTSARIHMALTMRTDFLGHCVRYLELPDAINRAQYLTPRLNRAQMERAIAAPAQVFGGAVETTLVAELINATGQNSDQLPLVQHALSRMWPLALRRHAGAPCITWIDAQAVGGVKGALGQHAEALLAQATASLPPQHTHLPEAVFRFITARRSGDQDVRRPSSVARITRACGLEPGLWTLIARVVEPFAASGASLLQHGPKLQPDSVVDLSHEALIRQWPRLSEWVADEARRGGEYRRWSDRASDHAAHSGSLLDGADLARAVDWWNPDLQGSGRAWQPTAAWAERYASSGQSEAAGAEYERTVAYISDSREVRLREAAERERARAQAQVLEAERAQARQTERLLRRTKLALLASVAFFLVAAAAGWWAVRSNQRAAEQASLLADETARAADARAEVARASADAARSDARRSAQLLELQTARAVDEKAARDTADRLRAKAETAERRATKSALEAARREKEAREALEEVKRQQALAEEQRRIAESQTKLAAASELRLRMTSAQEILNAIYDSGLTVDGKIGPRTSIEVRRLQAEVGLPETGRLDDPTWACVERLLRVDAAERKAALGRECGPSSTPTPSAADFQHFLNERGIQVPIDGSFGMVTLAALKYFQTLVGVPESGVLDAKTIACIQRVRRLPPERRHEDLKGACAE